MSEFRTSSGRSLPGYGIQEESRRTPNGFYPNRNPGRVGKGREEQLGKSKTREEIERWRDENLPDEGYYAVSAVRYILRQQRRPITAESVREGLQERGWLREQNS